MTTIQPEPVHLPPRQEHQGARQQFDYEDEPIPWKGRNRLEKGYLLTKMKLRQSSRTCKIWTAIAIFTFICAIAIIACVPSIQRQQRFSHSKAVKTSNPKMSNETETPPEAVNSHASHSFENLGHVSIIGDSVDGFTCGTNPSGYECTAVAIGEHPKYYDFDTSAWMDEHCAWYGSEWRCAEWIRDRAYPVLPEGVVVFKVEWKPLQELDSGR